MNATRDVPHRLNNTDVSTPAFAMLPAVVQPLEPGTSPGNFQPAEGNDSNDCRPGINKRKEQLKINGKQ